VPVFLERFILPGLAAVLIGVIVLNPFKFDWQQQLSIGLAILAIVYFVDHTIRKFDPRPLGKFQSGNPHPAREPDRNVNNVISKALPESVIPINPSRGTGARQINIIAAAPVTARVLSLEQITTIADALSKYPAKPVSFTYRGGDDDALRFCNQLVSAFVQGGWSASTDGSFMQSGITHGVWILPGSNLADVEPIYAALKNAKIDDLNVVPDLTPGGLAVMVASIRDKRGIQA
jgi:hypothetical protein